MGYGTALRDASRALGAWSDLAFFASPGFDALCARLDAETAQILPAPERAFAALAATAPEDVRVVILGQDPYPTPGHANGLAFSVAPGVSPLPASLRNIYTELAADTGATPPDGDLSGWAAQGVLLLNTVLTVRAGDARSHAGLGWEPLVGEVIGRVAARDGVVWILWGNDAKTRRPAIEAGSGQDRLILDASHPSPLSARHSFFGSRPFGRANAHLSQHGRGEIAWS